MRALVKTPHSRTEVCEMDAPEGNGVRIRIDCVGLCRTDLYVADGRIPIPAPIILGHEFAGVVTDKFGRFSAGDRVSVNPLYGKRFMGVHFDGALCDEIVVPDTQTYRLSETLPMNVGAFLEPVAASMAVLKGTFSPTQRGAIFGSNRIAKLTADILKTSGFNNIEPFRDDVEDYYDFVIETAINEQTLNRIVRALKPGGLLVIKSRNYAPVPFSPIYWVARELKIECVEYAPFDQALKWIEDHPSLVAAFVGDSYPLERFEDAFTAARRSETQKVFISIK